jgi:hypothetical protein
MALELIISGQPTTTINQEALDEWTEYRQDKRKPLSKLAMKKTQNLLLKYGQSHQQHIVDTAIMNDWQGLHPVPMPKLIITSTRDTTLMEDLTNTDWAT